MSYILEAIRKSEQERQEHNHVPDLNTVHNSARSETGRSINPWLIVVAVMGLIIVVLIALQLNALRDTAQTATLAEPGPVATPIAPPVQQAVTPTPQAAPQLVAQPTPQAQQRVQLPPPPVTAQASTGTNPVAQATPSGEPRDDIAKLYQKQTNSEQLAQLDAPDTLKNLPSDDKINALNRLLAERSTKPKVVEPPKAYSSIYDLPESIQQQIPTLKFGAHIYSETTNTGFSIINGRKQLPGSEIMPGLRVIQIQPSKVILGYQGYEFSVPAMRDWIRP